MQNKTSSILERLINYRRFSTTSSFAQAGQTCQQSAVVHISAIVSSDLTLWSNGNNNEQLFINLASVQAQVILSPAQSHRRWRPAYGDSATINGFEK